jgi:hypothetical protein
MCSRDGFQARGRVGARTADPGGLESQRRRVAFFRYCLPEKGSRRFNTALPGKQARQRSPSQPRRSQRSLFGRSKHRCTQRRGRDLLCLRRALRRLDRIELPETLLAYGALLRGHQRSVPHQRPPLDLSHYLVQLAASRPPIAAGSQAPPSLAASQRCPPDCARPQPLRVGLSSTAVASHPGRLARRPRHAEERAASSHAGPPGRALAQPFW